MIGSATPNPPKWCTVCGRPLTGRRYRFCSEACRKEARQDEWRLKVYGLTADDYREILLEQGAVCGCCRKPFKHGSTPHIDHEHGGHVRGIVCAYCNTRLIGRLKSYELAQKLADYLRDPPAVRAVGKVIAPGRPPRRRKPT